MRSRASLVARDGRRGVPVPLVRVGPARGDERVVGAASGRREGAPGATRSPRASRGRRGRGPTSARAPRDGIRVRVHARGRGERPEARRIRIGLGGIADIIAEGTGGEVVMREEGPEEGRRATRAIERRAADDRGEGRRRRGGEGGEGVGVEGPGEDASARTAAAPGRSTRIVERRGGTRRRRVGAGATTTKLDAFLVADVLSGELSGLSLGGGRRPRHSLRRIRRREKTRGRRRGGKGEGASSEHPSAGASVEPRRTREVGALGTDLAKARGDLKGRGANRDGRGDERPEEDGPEEVPRRSRGRGSLGRGSLVLVGARRFRGRAKSNSNRGPTDPPGRGPRDPGPEEEEAVAREGGQGGARRRDTGPGRRGPRARRRPRRRRGREKGKRV